VKPRCRNCTTSSTFSGPCKRTSERPRWCPRSRCGYPGKIKAGTISNEIVQHHDWLPTFLELAGNKAVVDDLKKGVKAIGRTYKNHIDGVSLLSYLTGKTDQSPRKAFVYISDDGDTLRIRYHNWKVVFMEQRSKGTMTVWSEPFTELRMAKLFNLRTDPHEFADITSNSYYDWFLKHAFIIYGAIALLMKFNATFVDFPKIQKPNTFTADQAIDKMHATVSGS
jgi:arylsulfatase